MIFILFNIVSGPYLSNVKKFWKFCLENTTTNVWSNDFKILKKTIEVWKLTVGRIKITADEWIAWACCYTDIIRFEIQNHARYNSNRSIGKPKAKANCLDRLITTTNVHVPAPRHRRSGSTGIRDRGKHGPPSILAGNARTSKAKHAVSWTK